MAEPVLTGTFAHYFYPRLVYNSITVDFDLALNVVVTPKPVRAQNISLNGNLETLYIREELIVTLSFGPTQLTKATAIMLYARNWGFQGKQGVLTLDRNSNCAGQLEYDVFNTSFTKAELLNDPLTLTRHLMAKPLYKLDLTFRQGV
jgi:hypothetical protein